MTAGVAAILQDLFNFESTFIPIIFCTIVTFFSILGIKSVASFFSITIPMMLIGVVIIAVNSLINGSFGNLTATSAQDSITNNWFLSSILYASYNASLASAIKRKHLLVHTVALSFFFLLILGVCIIIPTFFSEFQASDLPMLSAAKQVSVFFYYIYAFLLLLAMFGASISSLFPILDWHKFSYPEKRTFRVLMASLISVICVILSTLGFKRLVEHLYTYLGYLGIVFLCMVLYNCLLKHKLNVLFRRKQ